MWQIIIFLQVHVCKTESQKSDRYEDMAVASQRGAMGLMMEEENQTGVVYFYFRPFSTNSTVASLVFVGFLLLYLGSLIGNLTIGLTVWQDHSLHTPMYFFLFVLATLELGYSTNIAPLTLASILSMGKMLISLPSCGAQMFFFILLGGSDCVLLAIMAYDRMTSAEGKRRAFSTCSSHLLVVVLQYGCCTLIYLRPSSSYSPEEGRAVSVVYTFFSPLLNPLIYSLRNQEVTEAIKRLLARMFWFRKPERFLPGETIHRTRGNTV
ncbi:olfactory receptor 10V1-like isoform X3 [Arvicanthis niloticus]|uniref:olfactory receptor 10V1-like isoform X3 n=1 Tax=Arvicanthis niloticus TaxID=61156 RepID=UPI00402B7E38